MIVGAAAGRITINAVFKVPNSCVRATLIQSLRTLATPKAVLVSLGQSEQIKITNIDDNSLWPIVKSAMGIHARGEMGLRTECTGPAPCRRGATSQ